MKKFIIIFMIFSCVLCGCDAGYSKRSAGASEYQDALEIVRTAVPHRDAMNLRIDHINLLEEDSYGRRLFSYSMSEASAQAFVICQKSDDSYTYYYEDLCYILRNNEDAAFSDEQVLWLKNQNDWDKPIDEHRLRSVNFQSDQEDIREYIQVSKTIQAALDKKYPVYMVSLNGLETDADNRQIILATFCHEQTRATEVYLILYDHVNACVIISEAVSTATDHREEIIAFKKAYIDSED